MIRKIYIDTSVFGGYFDKEFDVDTKQFFNKVINDKITIIVSDVVTSELENAPDNVKAFYDSIPKEIIRKIDNTDEIKALANKYVEANIVSQKYFPDCLHIAAAIINNADVLVSWNFKHLVNFERKKKYNLINYQLNYKIIDIVTPKEVFIYDSE